MDAKAVANSVAYCGLICALCHESDKCAGCKSDHNCCGRHLSEGGCYQYNCCVSKGINGCWECGEGPCDRDMFGAEHDVRNRVFVKVARAEGVEKLAEYVCTNQQHGIHYGWNRDYDNLGSEEAVEKLLRSNTSTRQKKESYQNKKLLS